MQFEYNEETKITEVSVETDELCFFCSLFDDCPLLGALENNLVYPCADVLHIEQCPIYEPIVVDGTENN